MTNEEQTRYWNGDESAHWLVHEGRYERMGAPFTAHLLNAATIGRGDRVIDVGCGTGSTTRAAGRATGEGDVLGVDLSSAMVERAVHRARAEGLSNVRFDHGDAQEYGFTPGRADVALSRFGVMFFSDPAAAFANIARGLRLGGRLAFVCWQKRDENEWIAVLCAAAAQYVALPADDDPTAPGPFSLGERNRIATMLHAAALSDVVIESITEPLWMGADVADSMAFLTSTRILNSLLRNADPLTVDRVSEAIQAALEPYVTPDGVLMGSRAWLVSAGKGRQ